MSELRECEPWASGIQPEAKAAFEAWREQMDGGWSGDGMQAMFQAWCAAWNTRPAPYPSDAADKCPHGYIKDARKQPLTLCPVCEKAPYPSDAAWTEPCNQCGGFGGHEEGCTGHKAPSPSDAAFGKGIPTSLEVAWDDFAQRKGIATHIVNAYAVEFARERCADLQAQFRAHMEQAPSPSDAAGTKTRPTVAELEAILNDPRPSRIVMNPDGSISAKPVEAPSPSREGWLTEENIEEWRESFKVVYSDYSYANLNALCDMALSALRPATGVKDCRDDHPPIQWYAADYDECPLCKLASLRYSRRAEELRRALAESHKVFGAETEALGRIIKFQQEEIEYLKSALRPAGDEGLRIKAALAIIEAEGCDCDAEFRDEHTCLAGRIENALAPLPDAPATKEG